MNKIWLMARVTYRRRVRAGSFLLLTLGIPLLMVVAGAIPLLQAGRGEELPPVGYVDQTGQMGVVRQAPGENAASLPVTAYPDLAAAQAALAQGAIAGYLVIPPGYLAGTEQATFYGEERPGFALEEALTSLVRRALLPDAPAQALARLDDPSEITYVARASGLEVAEGPAVLIRFAFPAVLALVFALLLFTGANQMGSAVVQEKEQRAMEMVITSLSARQLVTGKVLGMTLLSLTQIGVWMVGGGIAVGLALAGTLDPADLSIPWRVLVWALLLGVPGYFLFAVLSAGLGVIAGGSQQAQQLAGILGMIALAPLWFAGLLVAAPDGVAAVALTLFPLTAPIFALFRMALTTVPTWQLATAFVLIVLALLAGIWLVAHIFRAAMLLYGQTLRPRQVWRALRAA